MSDHNVGKALLIFFILVTVINFGSIFYFVTNDGFENASDFLIACMIWFYGTIIVFDHIEPEDDDEDNDNNDDYI